MAKQRTDVMADDAVYFIYLVAISVGLLLLGMSMA